MADCQAEATTTGRMAWADTVKGRRRVSQGTEAHYCTRPQGHATGEHLCPCGYHWPVEGASDGQA